MRLEDLTPNQNSLKNRNYKISTKPNLTLSFKCTRSSNSHPVWVLGQQMKMSVKRQMHMPKSKDIDEEDNGGLVPLKAVVDHGVAVSNSEVSSSNFSSCMRGKESG
ncbi:hypothetical protein GBA52_024240 [Prunus armeniaca]|nr:hypothetical protein GBA52_024240 [Prunus armeniaca]